MDPLQGPEVPEEIENAHLPIILGQKPLVYNYDDGDANSNEQWSIDTGHDVIPVLPNPSQNCPNQWQDSESEKNVLDTKEAPDLFSSHNGGHDEPNAFEQNIAHEVAMTTKIEPRLIIDESIIDGTEDGEAGTVKTEHDQHLKPYLKESMTEQKGDELTGYRSDVIAEESFIATESDVDDQSEIVVDDHSEDQNIVQVEYDDEGEVCLSPDADEVIKCDEDDLEDPHTDVTMEDSEHLDYDEEESEPALEGVNPNQVDENVEEVEPVSVAVKEAENSVVYVVKPEADEQCDDAENDSTCEIATKMIEASNGSICTVPDGEIDETESEDKIKPALLNRKRESRNYHELLEDWEAEAPASDVIDEALGSSNPPLEDNIQSDPQADQKLIVDIVVETETFNVNDKTGSPVDESDNVELDIVHTFSPPLSENKVVDKPASNAAHNGMEKHTSMNCMEPMIFRNKKITSKDLIDAIDLIQTSVPTTPECVDVNRAEILGILESDQVGDWRKSIPHSTPVKTGNDLDIAKEIVGEYEPSTLNQERIAAYARRGRRKQKAPVRPPKVPPLMDKNTERELALKQLASFSEKSTKKRRFPLSRDVPGVAAADLGRALSLTPLLTGKKRKQPCYKPNNNNQHINADTIIKTYSAKQKSSAPVSDVETGLQTIAIVNKHVCDGDDNSIDYANEPQIEKKVVKKRRTRELQQLLGDEGAVKMIYDTAQKDSPMTGQPVFKKTKKGLEQKTKFVENAVIRLSVTAEKSLRGKRLKQNESDRSPPIDEPLFPPALPDQVHTTGRSRKKPKPAEASRILYRHSSSESFDGSEGMKRTSAEIAGLDISPDKQKVQSSKNYVTLQRKSSRTRKVNTKFSVYVAETLTPKRMRKNEEARSLIKEETVDEPIMANDLSTDSSVDPQTESAAPLSSLPMKISSLSKDVSEVSVRRSGGLVELTLKSVQPRIKNSFTKQILEQLNSEFMSANKDPSCRAVLLTTDGPVFCQGIDLSQLEPGSDVVLLIKALRSLVVTLAQTEKPIVVGVQGAAVGLGVALLPLCDVVVASDVSTYITPYSRLGQGLEAAASFTFPSIGKALVSELVYKGAELSATEAYQLGLVSQVVPSDNFKSELLQIALAVAAQSCQGLRIAKCQITEARRAKILAALDRECAALESAWTSAEWLGAAAEFLASGELLLNG